ncbi:apple domain-containing protein [Pseudoscourfieldia marina]
MGEVRKVLHGVRIADCPPELREKLAQYDTNGNGIIDPNELPDPMSAEMTYLNVRSFPKDLHPLLNDIDDEKNGKLEMDELTEIFSTYGALKRANKEGSISIKQLPKEIQPTLKVFDVDGDGTVAPMELARGAELYKDSKKTTKRLMTFSGVLLIVLVALVAGIVSLTAVVVEETKETKADNSGALVKKGTSTPVGTAKATKSLALFDMPGQSAGTLSGVKLINLKQFGTLLGYTITGYRATDTKVTFLASSGDVVAVDNNFINVTSASGMPVYSEQKSAKRRRGLLADDVPMAMVEASTTGNTAKAEANGVCFNLYHRHTETSGGLNPDSINPSDKANAEKECLDKCASMKDQGCVGFTMAGDKSVCYLKSAYDTTKPYVFAGEGSWTDYYLPDFALKNGYKACMDKAGAQTMQACAAEKTELAKAQKEAADAEKAKNEAVAAKKTAEDKATAAEDALAAAKASATAQDKLTEAELRHRVKIWTLDQGVATRGYGEMKDWDVSSVTDMSNLFDPNSEPSWTPMDDAMMGCRQEHKQTNSRIPDISSWDVSKVTDMSNMFKGAQFYDGDWINAWDISNKKVQGMFDGSNFNKDISNWKFPTDMSQMFKGAYAFNSPIGNWDVSQVTNMEDMFSGASAFNQPIGNWDVSQVTNMEDMFSGASAFNQPIGNWDVSTVTNMKGMFSGAGAFKQDINNWDTSNVKTMERMFSDNNNFNQPIGNWKTSKVEKMQFMFTRAKAFNQDISNWDTSNVRDMENMFEIAGSFNQDISKWDLSKVENTNNMFHRATSSKCSVTGKKITCSS